MSQVQYICEKKQLFSFPVHCFVLSLENSNYLHRAHAVSVLQYHFAKLYQSNAQSTGTLFSCLYQSNFVILGSFLPIIVKCNSLVRWVGDIYLEEPSVINPQVCRRSRRLHADSPPANCMASPFQPSNIIQFLLFLFPFTKLYRTT